MYNKINDNCRDILATRLGEPWTNHLCLGCRGRDRAVVGFTTTFAISAYHH